MTFKDLEKRLAKLIDDVGDAQVMDKVAKEGAKTVRKRTRRGFGVKETGGPSSKLTKLSDPYKKSRRRLKKQGNLSDETTPARSNLTTSGKMLDNIKGEGKDREARIYIDGQENNRKARQQAEAGREFMNLNRAEIKDAIDILEEEINKDIRKNGL